MPVPANGIEYSFPVSLADAADPASFLADPTIVAGDFQVSTDGGTYVNLATLPVVLPSGSISVLVSLSASEMTGAKVNVKAIDQSADEWQDALIFIDVPDGSIETMLDIEEGDRIESSTSLVIKKAGTETIVLEKEITGSLLSTSVTVRMEEP